MSDFRPIEPLTAKTHDPLTGEGHLWPFNEGFPQDDEFTPPDGRDLEDDELYDADSPSWEEVAANPMSLGELGFYFPDEGDRLVALLEGEGEDETPQEEETTLKLRDLNTRMEDGQSYPRVGIVPPQQKENLLKMVGDQIPDPGDEDDPSPKLVESLEAFYAIEPHEGGIQAGYGQLASILPWLSDDLPTEGGESNRFSSPSLGWGMKSDQ